MNPLTVTFSGGSLVDFCGLETSFGGFESADFLARLEVRIVKGKGLTADIHE